MSPPISQTSFLQRVMTHRLLRPAIGALLALSIAATAQCAELGVPQLLEQQEKWAEWVESEHKVQLTGRFKGRAANRLALQKLNIAFFPERGIVIPDRLPLGARLSLSGYFTKTDPKPEFRVTHLTREPSDYEQLHQKMESLELTEAATRYQLADRYEPIAEFYEDTSLEKLISECRTSTFDAQLDQYRRDPDALWKLVEPGPSFEVPEDTLQAVRFQVFVLRSRRQSDPALLDDIRRHLPGWQTPVDAPVQLPSDSSRDLIAAYTDADAAKRRQLERLLYRRLRLPQLLATVKADRSNALEVARATRQELSEEVDTIRSMESDWADHQLRGVRQLKRQELDRLVTLLQQIERPADASRALSQWLERQVEQFRNRGYEWQLRLADEFLHASTRWKNPAHQEEGIEYLKRAWTMASKEAPGAIAEIEERLGHFGIYHLNGRWMTSEQIERLPPESAVRAEREGHVVAGMTMEQARRILGAPTRRIRMASTRYVEDVWIYGERGTSRTIIRLRRRTTNPDDSATVTEVRQVSGIR